MNKSLKKHHRYNYWLYHWVGKSHGPRTPKLTANLKSYLYKYLALNKKNQIPPATMEKKSNFYVQRKQPMVPLDKELQWVNVKQSNSDRIRHIQA